MPSRPIPANPPKPKSPLRTASTPPPSHSTSSSSSSTAESPVDSVLFTLLSYSKSDDGDEVEVRFSDNQRFTFPTWWLYLSRKDEGLPSPDGDFCKTPSKIRVNGVKAADAGVRTRVDITWNTGTTSRFPALWLRVLGPTKALEQEGDQARLPAPGGKNPRSGVQELTLDEKRVRDRYREMLVEILKKYVEEEWLLEVPTSQLREMVRFVEVEIQSDSVAAQGSASEASLNAATADLSDKDSLVDEGMG